MKTKHIVLCILAVPVALSGFALWSSVFTKPVALLNKATDTTKMLANYEWFYEASNNFQSRVAQVKQFKTLVAGETDKGELSRLRVDLSAVQQSCRDLSAKYSAQSGKLHVGYMKSNTLPETLNMKECE